MELSRRLDVTVGRGCGKVVVMMGTDELVKVDWVVTSVFVLVGVGVGVDSSYSTSTLLLTGIFFSVKVAKEVVMTGMLALVVLVQTGMLLVKVRVLRGSVLYEILVGQSQTQSVAVIVTVEMAVVGG